MTIEVLEIILIPFIGTSLGACLVFFMGEKLPEATTRFLTGFAAGVMVAASFWSLLAPALDEAVSLGYGKFAFMPAAIGFLVGIGFLLLLDIVTPHMHMDKMDEGPSSGLKRTTKLVLAVTLHNIPEGMAVGVVIAGWISGTTNLSFAAAMALALGIAIQNFPEGAIVSMPLRAEGMSKTKTALAGIGSGVVEPIAGLLTIAASQLVVNALPFLLSFAAGAMLYVVVEELIPEMSEGKHSNLGTIAFSVGFVLMMALDVALS